MDEEYIKLLQQQAAAGSETAIHQLQQLGYDARIPDADASYLSFEASFPYAKTLGLLSKAAKVFNPRFIPNPEMAYRGIGKSGLKDALDSKVFRQKGFATNNPRYKDVFYGTGEKGFAKAKDYSEGFIAELPKNVFDKKLMTSNYSSGVNPVISTTQHIPINQGRILQKDFFRGYKPVKFKHGGSHDTDLDKVKKGLRYVESSNGLKMINPDSSATGLYGQLYNAEELQYMPYLQGVDRQSFASDTTLQNRLFEDRYFGKIPGVPGLGRNANDLRVEYKKVLEDKGIPFNYTDDEISALSNLLGRQGTREYFGYVLRDGRSLADVFPKIYGPDAEAPNKTPEKYLETYREGRDLKYGGNNMKRINKYENGGDPPKKHKDYLQYNPNYPFTGWVDSPYSYERLQNRITEDSLLLQDSWFPSNELMRNLQINREYRDKVKPYTKEELYDLKYEGDQSKAYGGRAIPQAGFGDMFKKLGQQIKTGLAGGIEGVTGGILPATKLLRPELRQTYADEMKMGNLFGSTVGFLGGAGLFSGAGAANAATSAAGMSSVPGANTFNALYGSGINPAMMNPSLAGQASTAGASGFGNLFNLGSNFGVGNTASGMFNIYQQGQEGMAMGGRATNMKQDMGQDINVESGELLMSAEGGQFQSMNPKAPVKEVMPGVSLVQGNQSNDNVPLKLPDGETMVFSKRLGYADKGLELVNQYKELEKTPDSNDFIGQQTKKFQLKRIKDKLQKLFREQESSKSKKIAKKTGNPQIPGAGLGDLFTKAKGFLQSDGFKQFGNKALEFAKDNPEAIYNIGQGLFAKDIPQIDASQYMTQFEPDPSLTKIDMGALMAPIRNQVASSQYNILRGGGTPAEKIAASMQLSGKAGSQLAAQEAKGQMLQNQLGLNIFERQAEIDRNNKMLALRLDMMNEQRGAARDMFFKEAVGDIGQYVGAKREENFMADLYNQRFGSPTTTGGNAGTGTGFNFSLGNMSQPSLGNFGLFDNYQGLNQ